MVPECRGALPLVDSLGNLVLITQAGERQSAQRASWETKKEIYAKAAARCRSPRDVLNEREWRRAEIEAREQRLVGLIGRLAAGYSKVRTSRPVKPAHKSAHALERFLTLQSNS